MNKCTRIDAFLEDIINNMNNMPIETWKDDISSEIKSIINSLQRCKKEFDSNLFLILAFGPVKSGKSTLINILAREEEISPTKFGIECTMRPSIIVKAKGRPCIKRYLSKGSQLNRDREKEDFNIVLDYIRGIAPIDEVKERVEIEEHDFSLEKIERFVAGGAYDYADISKEPLVTVIEIEAENSKVVDSNTAIVDVPGLDGAQANWRKSPIHDWILTRSDFLLFVQSSMAALNSETINFLKDVYINSKEPPMNLVQNIIEAKYWRGKEYLMKEAQEQRAKGIEQIKKLIPGIERSDDFDSSEVNLGISQDVLFNKITNTDGEQSKSSGFEALEKKLINLLDKRRDNIRFSNSMKSLKKTLEQTMSTMDELASRAKNRYEDIIIKFDNLSKIVNSLNNHLSSEFCDKAFYEANRIELGKSLEDFRDKYVNSYKQILDKFINEKSFDNISKSELDNISKDTNKKFENNDFRNGSTISRELLANLNKAIYNHIGEYLKGSEQDLNNICEELKLPISINAESYREFIRETDFTKPFESFDIKPKIGISKTGLMNFGKIDASKTKEKFKKSVEDEVKKVVDISTSEKVKEFFNIKYKEAIKDLQEKLDKNRDIAREKTNRIQEEWQSIEYNFNHYKNLINEELVYIRSQL